MFHPPGARDPKPWCDPSSASTSSTSFHLDLSAGGKACDKKNEDPWEEKVIVNKKDDIHAYIWCIKDVFMVY